jgi:hypothetical protein
MVDDKGIEVGGFWAASDSRSRIEALTIGLHLDFELQRPGTYYSLNGTLIFS